MNAYTSLHDVREVKVGKVTELRRDGVNGGSTFYTVDIEICGDHSCHKITLFADRPEALALHVATGAPIQSSQPAIIEPFAPSK